MKTNVDKHSDLYKKQRQRVQKALAAARYRCDNPNAKDFANYGALGIKVLIQTDALIALIGFPKPGESLDRIDPFGNYEAGNLRWANKAIQALNKKSASHALPKSLNALVAEQKHIAALKTLRPRVAEAWSLVIRAHNEGRISPTNQEVLTDLLGFNDLAASLFDLPNSPPGSSKRLYGFPALSAPNKMVRLKGNGGRCPDGKSDLFTRSGLSYPLYQTPASQTVPPQLREAINDLVVDEDCIGLALVEPTGAPAGFRGNLDVWTLAAASRLPFHGRSTAHFPTLICLEILGKMGSWSNWDSIHHPLLDAELLFIPDLQLDCGSWGELTWKQSSTLQNLLEFRRKWDHQTVVAIQSPAKLTLGLRSILLNDYAVRTVTAQHGDVAVSLPIGSTGQISSYEAFNSPAYS